MRGKREIAALIPIVIVAMLNIKCTNGFGISSFGKANTDPPKPASTTTPPGKTYKYFIQTAFIHFTVYSFHTKLLYTHIQGI